MIFNLSDKYNSILNYITLSDNLNDLYRSNKNIKIYFDSKGETNEFIENLCNENIYIAHNGMTDTEYFKPTYKQEGV